MSIHSSAVLAWYFSILAVILGAVFGSFLHCMAWRIAHNEKVTKGRSHCPNCGRTLTPGELIPVVSWLIQRGKCRGCGQKIPARYMLAELLMALLFLGCLWRFDITVVCLRNLVLLCCLFTLSVVDLDIFEIPDGLLIAAAAAWVIAAPFQTPLWKSVVNGLVCAVILGGAPLVISLVMDKLLHKDTLGGGDIKLLAVCGLYLGAGESLCRGLVLCLFGLILACIAGLVPSVIAKRSEHAGESDGHFPFGPAISAAMWIMLCVGQPLAEWYLGLF